MARNMEKQMKTTIPATSIKRPQRSQNPNWQYYAIATACCAVLVAGFFFAARQHFSSMEYGLQNSKLRRQLDELQSEKRRLLLNREIAISPTELRKAVRRIGFVDTPSAQPETVKAQNPSAQRSVIKAIENAKTSADRPANKVVKTVLSSPVAKPAGDNKQARRESSTQKKDRT
jgi:hypothetical protein